jgi:hypothetical protein
MSTGSRKALPAIRIAEEGRHGGLASVGDHAPTNHAITAPSIQPGREIVQQAHWRAGTVQGRLRKPASGKSRIRMLHGSRTTFPATVIGQIVPSSRQADGQDQHSANRNGSGDSLPECLRRVDDPTDVFGGGAGRPGRCWRDRRLAAARRRDRGKYPWCSGQLGSRPLRGELAESLHFAE